MTQPEHAQAADKEVLENIVEEQGRAETVAQRTLAGMTLADTEATITKVNVLIEASIKLTYPEDWLVNESPDGHQLCYLQDSGCQRIRKLWGISLDPIDQSRDVVEEKIDDADHNTQFLVSVNGRCEATGEELSDLGNRQSDGIFAKAWRDSKDEPRERARLRAEVRKSALANARGRLIRGFTGMNQVPIQKLAECGLDVSRCRRTDRQTGTRGGAGNLATTPQLRKLAGVACHEGKVATYNAAMFDTVLRRLEGAQLPKEKCSKLIERLVKVDHPIDEDTFWKTVGVAGPGSRTPPGDREPAPAATEPSAEEPPPPGDAAAPADPVKSLIATAHKRVGDLKIAGVGNDDEDPLEVADKVIAIVLEKRGLDKIEDVTEEIYALVRADLLNAKWPS